MEHKGLRYNQGKNRVDLLPPFALNEVAKVFTEGAKKYAENNWKLGMKWTSVLASLKRHLLEWESGKDIDPEDGCLLMAKVATNAIFLTEYSKIYPQGDDRWKPYLHIPKIGLDIDDVLADFIPTFSKKFKLAAPSSWSWSYGLSDKFKELFSNEKDVESFYLSIPAKIKPEDIPFEPHCYLTSRSVPKWVTETWIEENGFPCSPVISVPFGASKVEMARQAGIEVFVDDRFENFVELNNAGICCYLFDSPHNQRYNVGNRRIKSPKELPWFNA